MKVLLLGATGNVGFRLIPALLTHQHTVVAYVRSASKLDSLLPASINSQVTTIQGDAKNAPAIKTAILDNNCDAVVNTAGLAAAAPWGKSDLPVIFRAVVQACVEAGKERGSALRLWGMGGLGVLKYPGTESMVSNYIPIFLAHRQNIALLRSLPSSALHWSLLCPSTMTAEHSSLTVPAQPPKDKFITAANVPPEWKESWVSWVPWLGRAVTVGMNAGRYETTLEQNAELIARDLERGAEEWVGQTVGVISEGR